MRKGTSMLLAVLVQLVFAAVLLAMLFTFAEGVFSEQRFAEEVYATDNALLAEAAQARADGMLRMTYSLPVTHRLVLSPHRLELARAGEGTGLVGEAFTLRSDADLEPADLRTQVFQWVRAEDRLSVRGVSLGTTCPWVSDLPAWESVHARGAERWQQTFAHHAAEGALYDTGIPPEDIRRGDLDDVLGTPDLTIIVTGDDEGRILVRGDESPAGRRLRCLLFREYSLLPLEYPVEREADPQLHETTVEIVLPSAVAEAHEERLLLRDATIRALRRFAD